MRDMTLDLGSRISLEINKNKFTYRNDVVKHQNAKNKLIKLN